MKRICLVCDVFHPSEESTSQLFTGLLATLASDGLGFDVVTNGLPRVSESTVEEPGDLAGVRVHAVGIRVQGRGSLPLRLVRNMAFVMCATLRLLWLRTDRYWASTNPPFTPVWVAVIALLRRKPFDVIVHDVYPDGLVAVGYLGEHALITRVWQTLNRWAYSRAAKVVVLGRDMAQVLHDRYGVPHERLVLYPHWSLFDQTAAPSLEESRLAQAMGLTGKFVVQYSGNMGLWHDIDAIVEAATLLQDLPQVHFLMIGGGRRRGVAQELARQRGLTNMTWIGSQHRQDLPDSLACASVALISQREQLTGIAVPCKLYGILAAGRPIVAAVPANCEVAHVVREEGCGVVVSPGEPRGMADAVRSLVSSEAALRQMAERSFAAYCDTYSLAAARDRFWQRWFPSDN